MNTVTSIRKLRIGSECKNDEPPATVTLPTPSKDLTEFPAISQTQALCAKPLANEARLSGSERVLSLSSVEAFRSVAANSSVERTIAIKASFCIDASAGIKFHVFMFRSKQGDLSCVVTT